MRICRFHFGLRVVLALFFVIITISELPEWVTIKKLNVYESTSEHEVPKVKPILSHGVPASSKRYSHVEKLLKGLLIQEKDTGCTMPNLDPFAKEYAKFYKNVQPVSCGSDDWVECDFSQCYVKKSILKLMKDTLCAYKDIVYVNDDEFYIGKEVIVRGDGKYTLNVSDHVRVSCSGVGSNSSKLQSKWQGRKAGYRPLPEVAMHSTSLNVLLFVIDSVSRNAFMRRMPISYKILKDELQAVMMYSYNIVGQGTAEAMWPILTGHNDLEVSDSGRRPGNAKRVDPKPFLFTLLKEHGYRTAFLEDMPWTGTFNRLYNGFERMPTDHYLRHLTKDIGIYNSPKWSTTEQYCFGSEPIFKFIVEYTENFLRMKSKKFCITVSASYSHDDVNMLTLVDGDLANFLRKFKRVGHLKDTLLFVMADHGPRISGIRDTYIGRVNEHLPFVSVILPDRLKMVRPDALPNLVANSRVLTTPYDIHTTILDALNLTQHKNKYKVPGANLERGISLLERIPETRGCAEAGIVPHYCICTKTQNVPVSDAVSKKVVQKLASFVNVVTSQERHQCAKRHLASVVWVHRLEPMLIFRRLNKDRKIKHKYYQAKIIMDPGEAIFEGSVVHNIYKDSFSITDRDVSRVDRYGEESICVQFTHPHLSKYCYCRGI